MTRGATQSREPTSPKRTKASRTKAGRAAAAVSDSSATSSVRVRMPKVPKVKLLPPSVSGWFLRYVDGQHGWESSDTADARERHYALCRKNEEDHIAARDRKSHHCAKNFSVFLRRDAEGRAYPLEVGPMNVALFDQHNTGLFGTIENPKEPFPRDECAKIRSVSGRQFSVWHTTPKGVLHRCTKLAAKIRKGLDRPEGGLNQMPLRPNHQWKVKDGVVQEMMHTAQHLLDGTNGDEHGLSISGGAVGSAPLATYAASAAAASAAAASLPKQCPQSSLNLQEELEQEDEDGDNEDDDEDDDDDEADNMTQMGFCEDEEDEELRLLQSPSAPQTDLPLLESPVPQQLYLSPVPSDRVPHSAQEMELLSLPSSVDDVPQGPQLLNGNSAPSVEPLSRSGSHGLAVASAAPLDDEEISAHLYSLLTPAGSSPLRDDDVDTDPAGLEDEQPQQHAHDSEHFED